MSSKIHVNVHRDIHGPMLQCKYCGLWRLVQPRHIKDEENGKPYRCYTCRENNVTKLKIKETSH